MSTVKLSLKQKVKNIINKYRQHWNAYSKQHKWIGWLIAGLITAFGSYLGTQLITCAGEKYNQFDQWVDNVAAIPKRIDTLSNKTTWKFRRDSTEIDNLKQLIYSYIDGTSTVVKPHKKRHNK